MSETNKTKRLEHKINKAEGMNRQPGDFRVYYGYVRKTGETFGFFDISGILLLEGNCLRELEDGAFKLIFRDLDTCPFKRDQARKDTLKGIEDSTPAKADKLLLRS
jgi:hypothetical protein